MVVAFGNVTANQTHRWTPEPDIRGTWTLLTSCIITIALCAWTALHLNLPEHGTAERQWLRKTKWLVLGLTAPEMVVYVAWRQRQEARRVLWDVRKSLRRRTPRSIFQRMRDCCLGSNKSSSSIHLTNPTSTKAESLAALPAADTIHKPDWTLVHGFYAVMGGFAFDTSEAGQPFLPESRTRIVLTSAGIRFLLDHKPDLLPAISEEQIKDKSKADGLQKCLICVQAIWFCASCISRLANSLPISLLELNALGHAACALLIYAMWWHKPLDVDEPTLIQGTEMAPLAAYMWMSAGISAKGYQSHDLNARLRDEFDALWTFRYATFGDLIFPRDETAEFDAWGQWGEASIRPTESTGHEVKILLPPPRAPGDNRLDPIKYPMCGRQAHPSSLRYRLLNYFRSHPWLSSKFRVRFAPGLGIRDTAIDYLSPATVRRWRLAYQAIREYHLEDNVWSRQWNRSSLYDQDSRVKARIGNLLPLIGSRPLEVWVGFAVAGALYGGLHMLAWDAPFESRAEKILWRVAASSVTMTPLLFAPIALAFGDTWLRQGATDVVRTLQGQRNKRKVTGVRLWATGTLVVLLLPLFALTPLLWASYVLGRVYLVVECFRNVAHLPEGVFQTVAWPHYLPHIS